MEARHEKLFPYLSHSNEARVKEATKAIQDQNQREFLPGLSIVILNLDKPELICPLIEKLVQVKQDLKNLGIELEIIIGDTGSHNPEVLKCYTLNGSHIKVGRDLKYNFSKNNNEMFGRFVTKDLVLFMNNDIIFKNDARPILIEIVHQFHTKPRIGILGATLLYEDLKIQHFGIDFFYKGPLRGLPYHPGRLETFPNLSNQKKMFWPVPSVTGAFLAIKSVLFEEVGGFDEDYRTECQDVDLCLMTRNRGYDIEIMVSDQIIHLENATREKNSEDWVDRQKFVRQWGSYIEVGLI